MDLASAIVSAKATLELLTLSVKARDDAKIQTASLELREQLFAMSDIAMAYIEKNASLVSQVAALTIAQAEQTRIHAELVDRFRERENYPLHEIRPGRFVHIYKPLVQGSQEPAHYLCQACFSKQLKMVLQQAQRGTLLVCPADANHSMRIEGLPPPNVPSKRWT